MKLKYNFAQSVTRSRSKSARHYVANLIKILVLQHRLLLAYIAYLKTCFFEIIICILICIDSQLDPDGNIACGFRLRLMFRLRLRLRCRIRISNVRNYDMVASGPTTKECGKVLQGLRIKNTQFVVNTSTENCAFYNQL
jgi:hypothetical protein